MLNRIVIVLFLILLVAQALADDNADRAILLEGVHEIDSPGVPGPLLIFGNQTFPVIAGKLGKERACVVAAGRLGRGRFVAFGHEGYLRATGHDTPKLLANSVRWVSKKSDPHVFAPKETVITLAHNGIKASPTPVNWAAKLDEVDVICLGQEPLSLEQISAIQSHMKKGGGVIITGLAWGWLQITKNKPLIEHPGNQIFMKYGLMWADGYLEDTTPDAFDATVLYPESLRVQSALQIIPNKDANAQAKSQSFSTLMLAARTLPANDIIIRPTLRRIASEHTANLVPTPQHPLISGKDDLARFLLTYNIAEEKTLAPDHVKANPAAAQFPGLPDRPAKHRLISVNINPDTTGWKSTGAYALPGQTISVLIPGNLKGKGLRVQIGCHTDTLYHKDQWKRAPDIVVSQNLDNTKTIAASAFGGPVYIILPDGVTTEPFTATIDGVIDAPLFVLDKTDPDQWKSTIRLAPAPWAELVTDKVILSVPSSSIRNLDDPEALLRFWDQILDTAADLATISHTRKRPQRYAADVQISAGYMHSGYPIMTHLDAAADMTQLEKLRKGSWGLFHELGHNHQAPDWTFDGTVEVTCNLFTLYILDTICELPAGTAGHEAVRGDVGLVDYIKSGSPFDQWKRKPFLALRMYIQIQDAFGWEPFKTVFAQYRALPANERPKNDDEKRDQWLVRLSRVVGRNLGPFFEAWGVPTSEMARSSIQDLPEWMPDGFPPN